MLDIAFVNETNQETEQIEAIIETVFDETLKIEDVTKYYEVSVIFVTDEKIREINRDYRNIDKVTDVISFALFDDEESISNVDITTLGDIFISIDKAKLQAEEYGHSIEREMGFLACHGLLHLLGYDHDTQIDEEVMFKKQEIILNNCNLKRL